MKKQGKKLQLKTIKKAVEKSCAEYKIDFEPYQINLIAEQLKDINDILAKNDYLGRKLFALVEREPRGNLDSGSHYYSINYIKNNKIHKLWLGDFYKVVGGCLQNRWRHLDRYLFCSGAIGMSRVLDATDGLFLYLAGIGGFYHQIDCR